MTRVPTTRLLLVRSPPQSRCIENGISSCPQGFACLAAAALLAALLCTTAGATSPVERLPPVERPGQPGERLPTATSLPSQSRAARYRSQRLIDRATDPTAWLMQYHFRDRWIVPIEEGASDENDFQFRPTIPFLAWDQVNIFRAEVNYDIEMEEGSGLHDARLFDLIVFDGQRGRWGVGPAIQLKPNSSESFSIGPAAAAVARSKHWTVGLLSENFFGGDNAESFLEPVLAYKFDERWSMSVGEMKFEYDWQSGNWNRVPLSLSLDYISSVFGQKVRWFINPAYNFRNSDGDAEWMFNFGFDLLVPDA